VCKVHDDDDDDDGDPALPETVYVILYTRRSIPDGVFTQPKRQHGRLSVRGRINPIRDDNPWLQHGSPRKKRKLVTSIYP